MTVFFIAFHERGYLQISCILISTEKKSSSFLDSSSMYHFLYLLIARSLGPNRKKTHGNGVNARAINPSKLLAQ